MTERRERGDAIEAFKTLNGINKVDKNKWFDIEQDSTRATRRNTEVTEEGERRRENVLKEEAARLEVRRNSYTVRAAKIWNKIPEKVREQKSTNAFKNAFDKWTQAGKKNQSTDSAATKSDNAT